MKYRIFKQYKEILKSTYSGCEGKGIFGTILAIALFIIISVIDIDYNLKWKVNTVVSIAHKITVVQLMTDIRPAILVPVVDKTNIFNEFFESASLSNFVHYWKPCEKYS